MLKYYLVSFLVLIVFGLIGYRLFQVHILDKLQEVNSYITQNLNLISR